MHHWRRRNGRPCVEERTRKVFEGSRNLRLSVSLNVSSICASIQIINSKVLVSTVFHHPSNNPNDRTHFKAEHLIVSLSPAYLDFTHGTVTDLQCCFYATVSFDNHRQTSQRSFLSSTKKFHASLHKIITYMTR